ncbi:MAG: helix-turn-helix domain-containing protein [Geminicoccaceae bacterium]
MEHSPLGINHLRAENVGWNMGIIVNVASVSSLITPQKIILAVCSVAEIPLAEFMSDKRNRSVCRPRQIAMLIIREACQNMSFPDIARQFSRDHTTVLHGIKAARKAVKQNVMYAELYEKSCQRLGIKPYAFYAKVRV